MIKYLDMFCGISAFRSAAEMIGGFECVGYCDNDPTAIAAYRSLYNTDKEVFYDDARTIDTDAL
jgi:DNA (cytosine-5)-methyltransferase 1